MGKLLQKILWNSLVLIPLIMGFSNATFIESLLAVIGLGLFAFAIGDQFVLRMSNNLVATVADAVLAYLFLLFVSDWLRWTLDGAEILVLIIALGVVEFLFHRALGYEGEWETI